MPDRIGALLALLTGALVCATAAGCGSRPLTVEEARKEARRAARAAARATESSPPLEVAGKGNVFTVNDPQGRRLLEAKVARIDTEVQAGGGLERPLLLRRGSYRLFQKGRFEMTLETPEATWDGELLRATRSVHAVTADGGTIIDARAAVWTADRHHLALEQARMESRKGDRVQFTVEGPRAEVVDQVITMDRGGTARNPDGETLRADRVKWGMRTGHLDAQGNVVVTSAGVTVTGGRLRSDTRLRRGKMSGSPKVVLTRLPGPPRAGKGETTR